MSDWLSKAINEMKDNVNQLYDIIEDRDKEIERLQTELGGLRSLSWGCDECNRVRQNCNREL